MPTPNLSRRTLLKSASVIGAAAAATMAGAPAVRADAMRLKASTFEPLVGERFVFDTPGRSLTLRLTAVEATDSHGPADEDAFVLRLSGPRAHRQGGEVGVLSAPGQGSAAVLVVPGAVPASDAQEWFVTVDNRGHHV